MGKKKDDTYNRVVDHYRRVVNRGASIEEACRYGVDKKMLSLPIPKDPFATLVQRVTRAQRRQRSFDKVLRQPYNTNICYLFGDEYRWIKEDKAALENAEYSQHKKRSMAVNLMTTAERNALHWYRTRGADEQLQLPEKDLGPDVLWNLNQSKDDKEDTGTND